MTDRFLGRRLAARVCGCAGALLVGIATAAAAQPSEPLWGLEVDRKGRIGWDEVALGDSLVQAEREVGVTLSVETAEDGGSCVKYVAEADHHGLRLTMGFRAPKPGSKIDWLQVRLEGEQLVWSGRELVEQLLQKVEGLEWIPPADGSVSDPTEDLAPTFRVPGGKQPQVIRLLPREAVILAMADCL